MNPVSPTRPRLSGLCGRASLNRTLAPRHLNAYVGSIPETFYPKIAKNEAQREEWVTLLGIDGIKGDLTTPSYSPNLEPEFLKTHPTLMLDTRNFDDRFTARLLEALDNLSEKVDGVVFHSENFQALAVMRTLYRKQVQAIYIDPPYNTAASEIAYKNSYKHSSWLSLMRDRIECARAVMGEDGVICVAIDDAEFAVSIWHLLTSSANRTTSQLLL